MTIIGIDNGYDGTKVVNGTTAGYIRSRVEESQDIGVVKRTEGRYTVEYDGKVYTVGEGVHRSEVSIDKTRSSFHKILTLTSLSTLCYTSGVFQVVAGLPINYFKAQKDKFAEYLKTNGAEIIIVNGKEKQISIQDVKVFPQGAGALYADEKRAMAYSNKKIGIIDWGGYSVDACVFDKLRLDTNSIFTHSFGTHRMNDEIAKNINGEHSLNVQKDSIENVVNEHNGKSEYILLTAAGELDIKPLVTRVLKNCVSEVYQRIMDANWEIGSMPILHTGGATLFPGLAAQIGDMIPLSEFSADPVFDNALGFYNIAQQLYKNER